MSYYIILCYIISARQRRAARRASDPLCESILSFPPKQLNMNNATTTTTTTNDNNDDNNTTTKNYNHITTATTTTTTNNDSNTITMIMMFCKLSWFLYFNVEMDIRSSSQALFRFLSVVNFLC